MKIKWWGHSTFLITTDKDKKILLDPYVNNFPYKNITDQADIVTSSHDHFDHNGIADLKGEPEIIRESGNFTIDDIKIKGIPSKHDDVGGKDRGDNIIFLFEIADKKIAHLGDLGHLLNKDQLKELQDVNILLLPVGGHFTIDAAKAYQICCQLKPEIIIPMHYKTPLVDLPIKGVEKFTLHFDQELIHKIGQAELEINELPDKQEVIIMEYIQ